MGPWSQWNQTRRAFLLCHVVTEKSTLRQSMKGYWLPSVTPRKNVVTMARSHGQHPHTLKKRCNPFRYMSSRITLRCQCAHLGPWSQVSDKIISVILTKMRYHCQSKPNSAQPAMISSFDHFHLKRMTDSESDVSGQKKPEVRIYAINTEWDRGPNWMMRICVFWFSIPGCRCRLAGKM